MFIRSMFYAFSFSTKTDRSIISNVIWPKCNTIFNLSNAFEYAVQSFVKNNQKNNNNKLLNIRNTLLMCGV